MSSLSSPAMLEPAAFRAELSAIAKWWLAHAFDAAHGGVYGEIADDNSVVANAEKSAILQTRALWFFSEYAGVSGDADAREAARRLYGYIVETFIDREEGGVFWSVAADGTPMSMRKQTYAQAFAVYALSAYARNCGDADAQRHALELARLIEERAWEPEHGGYLEAFARDWSAIDDYRLSARDLNAPKTMNTHLHVLECYSGLHRLVRSDFTKAILEKNIRLFDQRFAAPRGGKHLALFYTTDWRDQCADESYGHDIEASWLLYEAAEALGDEALMRHAAGRAVSLAVESLSALDKDGGLIYERHAGKDPDRTRQWWPQAEAMVGFYNAWRLTGEERFRRAAAELWSFINNHVIDREQGEWFWHSTADKGALNPYKVGFWKGPYHNGRAMMEMLRRLEAA
jgi:mannobiose 2-epimerase